jgi:hypothetical protein
VAERDDAQYDGVASRLVFERLFGDGGSAAAREARNKSDGSILDSMRARSGARDERLAAGDKTKLSEYLDSVREGGAAHSNMRNEPAEIELPERPTDCRDFDAYTKLMLDLQALAFRADITRVFSMIMSRELSSRTFAHIGVPEQHHACRIIATIRS